MLTRFQSIVPPMNILNHQAFFRDATTKNGFLAALGGHSRPLELQRKWSMRLYADRLPSQYIDCLMARCIGWSEITLTGGNQKVSSILIHYGSRR